MEGRLYEDKSIKISLGGIQYIPSISTSMITIDFVSCLSYPFISDLILSYGTNQMLLSQTFLGDANEEKESAPFSFSFNLF
jgi:hypothetical protein